jgi:hypothetical protein
MGYVGHLNDKVPFTLHYQLLTIDIAVAGVSGAMRLITTYMFQLRHNDDFPNK